MADKITSPDELKALADEGQGRPRPAPGRKETQVTVHMGTCGIAAGARDVLAAFMAELAAAGVTDVSLHQTGCAGLCEQEPMVTVTRAGRHHVPLRPARRRTRSTRSCQGTSSAAAPVARLPHQDLRASETDYG